MTPVRTGPLPTTSFPLPEMSVVWPTSTPGDVGDRVERAGGPADERHEAELARPWLVGGGRRLWTERDRGEHQGE